jgi:MFS transporter, AAHS family, benzoate transport protein
MRQIDAHKLADEATFNSFHGKIFAWCFLIIVIDGYDLAVTGAALPAIMEQMKVGARVAGLMASSALFGMMFGAAILGFLGDKIGRRWSISISIILFSVFTTAAGLMRDPISFSMMRFLAGLGIGGVLPAVVVQLTEYSPRKVRVLMTTGMSSGYAVGGVLAAVLGKQLIGDFGWQAVFIAAAAPLLLVPFILKVMPESLSYMIAKQDDTDLRRVVREIRPDLKLRPDDRFVVPDVDKAQGASVSRIFQDGRAISTLLFWTAFFSGMFMIYALGSWLTKLMAMSGYSLGSALTFLICFNVGALAGAVFGGFLSDRFRIKYVVVVMYALGGVFLYLMTVPLPAGWLYVLVGLIGACTSGAQIVVYAYCGQYYPMAIRSTGVGFASGVGRMGAIVAPLLIGQIVALNLPLRENFLVIGAFGIVGAIALAFINDRHSAIADEDREEEQKAAQRQSERGRNPGTASA